MTKGKGKNNKQGGGHPPKQRSLEEEEIRPNNIVEEEAIRRNNNIQRNRNYRERKKCKLTGLEKRNELFMEFCKELGIAEKFDDFCEKRVKEEEKRIFSEELEKLGKAIEEDGANQHSDEEFGKILKDSSKNLWATLEENLESEMIQTGELEDVTAMSSSSLGAMGTPFDRLRELKRKRGEDPDGACRGKRPATAHTTPSRPPIGGFMADAPQNYGQSMAAVAPQGTLLSTNKGTRIQMREATHDREASTSSWAPPPHHELGVSLYNLVKQYGKLKDAKRRQQEADRKFKEKKKEVDNSNKQVKGEEEVYNKLMAELAEKNKISKDALVLQMFYAVTLGFNLTKELLQSMQPGSEFPNLPLLDIIQRYPSLQSQFNEGLTLIGQGHPIEDKVAIQSDNPPVVVPRSFFRFYEGLESVLWGPNVSASLVDAANIAANSPQFQAANGRANNVGQEDDANDQRMDEATEANNLDEWMELRDADGGEDL